MLKSLEYVLNLHMRIVDETKNANTHSLSDSFTAMHGKTLRLNYEFTFLFCFQW